MRNHHSVRLLAVLLALVMVMTMIPGTVFATGEKSQDIVILYTNDTHCGVDAEVPEGSMGFANLAAYKKAMEEQHENVVLIDNGDAIQGEAIGTLSNGDYLVDIMNFVGYDYAIFGNHEFDYGMDVALSLLENANAQYLSCNFMDLRTNAPVTKAYDIVTYGELDVAYIGIATPETFTKSTPAYFQDENGNYIYGFCEGNNGQDLYDAVQKAIDDAKAEGADIIIALGHLGIDEVSEPWTSYNVIANTTGLDAFLDGHSHSVIPGEVIKDKAGNEVILSSTGTKLNNIGKLTITTDGELSTELVTGYTEVDAETDEFIKGIQAQFEDKLNEVVAETDVTLTVYDPITGNRIIRNQESNLGDLCADAYRIVLGADIAFVNGGGIRANIEEGEITYGEVIAVHPFGNMACTVEATGQEIVDALEMCSRAVPGELGGFLQVSGVKYTVNQFIPSTVTVDDKGLFVSVGENRRVSDVEVLQDDGTYAPIDLEATYVLASHNYMLKDGGDGITMFMDNKVLQDEVMIDNQVLITYIRDHLDGVVGEQYANPYGEGRITIASVPADVKEGQWYYDYVEYVYENGLMNGMSLDAFMPNATVTRAQIAQVLYRLAGSPEYENASKLTDINEDAWYAEAVQWAATEEIVIGYEDGSFKPMRAITREELVTMVYRYAEYAGYRMNYTDDLSAFTDAAKVQPYALEAMQWAVGVGLIDGMNDGTLAPRGTSIRAQLAAILYRLCETTTEINLMATSDVHGQIFATDYTAGYEASGTYRQGLPYVATFVKEQREEYPNSFLVDCGDLIQGTPLTYYYAFYQPEVEDPTMKALRIMDYDMFVPGNHEFNYGMTILQRQLDYLTSEANGTESSVAVSLANYLATETNDAEEKDWATWNDYAPYIIYEFDGVKVAVMGIGNPNVPKWDVPANWEGIYFAGVLETYEKYEAEMLEKADMIVLASHSGIDSASTDSDFIRALVESTNSIDLVFTGHEHRSGITEIANADGENIPVYSLNTKCAYVGQTVVTFNLITGEYTLDTRYVPMTENRQPVYEQDAELVEALQAYETATWEDYMLQPIGTATGNFSAADLGAGPSAFVQLINDVQTWGAYDRTGENTPDDASDDVKPMLSITAPLTSGNAENLIPEGNIVLGDMFRLYRYENWFYQITMSAKEVDTWLEYSASKVELNEDGSVNILGGLTYYDVITGEGFYYEIDPRAEVGDRVAIFYGVDEEGNRLTVAEDFVFTVVVNNYRYNGGGGYVEWMNANGCEFIANDENRVIYSTQYDMMQGEDKGQARNLLADYITEQGELDPADYTIDNWVILGAN